MSTTVSHPDSHRPHQPPAENATPVAFAEKTTAVALSNGATEECSTAAPSPSPDRYVALCFLEDVFDSMIVPEKWTNAKNNLWGCAHAISGNLALADECRKLHEITEAECELHNFACDHETSAGRHASEQPSDERGSAFAYLANTYAGLSDRPFNEAMQGIRFALAMYGDNPHLAEYMPKLRLLLAIPDFFAKVAADWEREGDSPEVAE